MEKIVILTAGNPNLYPLEYYDTQKETYEGMIPRLLEQFSNESRYEIRYLDPGSKDARLSAAKNRQADLISGCVAGEEYPYTGSGGVTLLETQIDGETVEYQILFTDAAPEAFQEDFRQFISEVSAGERNGMLMLEQKEAQDARMGQLQNGMIGLSVAVLILLCLIGGIIWRYRRKLKRSELEKETDEVTGMGNETFLERNFPLLVTDRTRILYTAICFYIDTDKAEHLSGYEDTRQFLQHAAVILNEYVDQRDLLVKLNRSVFILFKSSRSVQEWIPTALARIREFSHLYGKPYQYDIHCGIYLLQNDDGDLDEILFKIIQSARMAHRIGEDYVVCTRDLIQKMNHERQLFRRTDSGF